MLRPLLRLSCSVRVKTNTIYINVNVHGLVLWSLGVGLNSAGCGVIIKTMHVWCLATELCLGPAICQTYDDANGTETSKAS